MPNRSTHKSIDVTFQTRKRGLRILPKSGGYFVHVTSRVVQQKFLFEETEKAVFTDLLYRWADFSGIGILTYCLMNNHIHLLLWIPPVQQVRTEEIVRRLGRVWPERKVRAWLEAYGGSPEEMKREKEAELTRRMHNLPDFMRVLKQGFSAWYNKKHNLYGVFWDGRYRSMVLKDSPEALCSVAAYVDLNPVRAGICTHPHAYAWSGYGQANRGNLRCREGLTSLIKAAKRVTPRELGLPVKASAGKAPGWKMTEAIYRTWLYAKGYSATAPAGSAAHRRARRGRTRRGFAAETVLAVFAKSIQEIKGGKE